MITRRENPDGGLWGLAVKSFNQLLVDDISKLSQDISSINSNNNKPARIRLWKEVADVYEIFLVGYCGRALPSSSLAAISKEDDESLEMELLDVLGDKVLMSDIDASPDVTSFHHSTYIFNKMAPIFHKITEIFHIMVHAFHKASENSPCSSQSYRNGPCVSQNYRNARIFY